jgi:transketolase
VLNALAPVVTNLIGGSADLDPSTKTSLKGYDAFQKATPAGETSTSGCANSAWAGS